MKLYIQLALVINFISLGCNAMLTKSSSPVTAPVENNEMPHLDLLDFSGEPVCYEPPITPTHSNNQSENIFAATQCLLELESYILVQSHLATETTPRKLRPSKRQLEAEKQKITSTPNVKTLSQKLLKESFPLCVKNKQKKNGSNGSKPSPPSKLKKH